MRRIAALLIVSLPAFGQSAGDFRWEAPVTVSGGDALNRLTLPFEAYRDARPDFGDLRLFNAAGEALPIAFAGEPAPVVTGSTPTALAIFPISAEPGRDVLQGSLDVLVKSDARGTIVSVQGRSANKPAPMRTAAWLVDASQFAKPMRGLVIAWDVHPGTEVVKVDVDASDDLKAWRRVASRAPLMHLEQSGAMIEQRRVDLSGLRAKYLRIAGEPTTFALTGVSALSDDVVAPAARSKRLVQGAAGTKPGEYLFDLGARIPVDLARIVLPANTVAPFVLYTRDDDKQPWRTVTAATFYNLTREGATLESQPAAVNAGPMRHVMAQLDPRSPPLSSAPSLEVQWRPAQLVFVARGDGPYHLEFGNREAKATLLAVSQLIPSYEAHAEMKLAEAKVGAVQANAPPEPAWRAAIGDTNPRKLALWAILIVAVFVLAGMAWRLSSQMKGGAKPPQ